MMLDHYQQTKNLLVSTSNKALGFFGPAKHGARPHARAAAPSPGVGRS
jgi:hypothetical protein